MTASAELDRLIASWLETAGPADVADDVVTAALVETRTLPQRRAPWPFGPRSWPAPGVASGLPWRTIVVTAVLIAALAAALALMAGATPPTPLGMTGNVAIVLRQPEGVTDTVDVIAVGVDGRERLVRRFGPGDVGGRRVLPYGEVSLDGWFALALGEDGAADGAFALLRLDDPSRPPLYVDYVPVIGGAWSPTGGRFATTTSGVHSGFEITVTDATTGSSQDVGSLSLPGGGPSLLWTADGSGIIVQGDRGLGAVRPLGGRLLLTRPTAIWWPTGARFVRPGASSEPPIQGELDGSPLMASSYAAEGTAAWGLYDEVREGQHTAILALSDGAGPVQVIARVPLGEDVTNLWFAGLDPGDARMAISSWVGADAVLQPIRIVETATGRVTSVVGNLIGFVPPGSLGLAEGLATSPGPTATPAARMLRAAP